MFNGIFEQSWYQELVSHGVPRWKHFVAWAKERAKHDGLIKPPSESGTGFWEFVETDQEDNDEPSNDDDDHIN